MNYQIRPQYPDEPLPYDLLLLADPDREHVDEYVPGSHLYVLELNRQVVGVGVLQTHEPFAEIVNLAVAPEHQRKGLGRALLPQLMTAARQYGIIRLLIATGNSSIGQMALYQQQGFDLIDIDRDYFLRHYAEPIWENGIQCKHQLIFVKTFE